MIYDLQFILGCLVFRTGKMPVAPEGIAAKRPDNIAVGNAHGIGGMLSRRAL